MREAVRQHRFAFAFIGLIVLVLFAPSLARREVFTVRDHTDYFQPLRYLTAVHMKAFVLPYWNPYSASGEPWLANPQTAVFYPPAWLFIPLPFETAYMLFLALHLVVLGWGAYLLFARSVSEGAALVGAVAIVFAGPTLSLLDINNNLATFAWIPWVIWAGAARRSPAVAGLVIALSFLGGEPFFAAVGALLYAVVRMWEAPAGGGRHVENATALLLTALVAIGLSAIQLLPFLEMTAGSDRAARLSAEEIFRESMPLSDWLRVAVPPRLNANGFDPALSQHFIPMIYVGMAVAVLAVAAWVFVRRREVLGWTLLLAASMLVAAGHHLPLSRIVELLPLTPFRYPSRALPFGALALAALAALGWNRFRPQRRWADLLLAVVLIADLLPRASPLLRTGPFRTDHLPYPQQIGRAAKFTRLNEEALVDRAPWMAGYVNLYQQRFDSWTAAPLISERYARVHEEALASARLDLLSFLGTGFLLSDRQLPLPMVPLVTVRGVTAYAVPTSPRMGTLWNGWRACPSDEEALQLLLGSGTAAGVPVSGSGISTRAAAQPRRSSASRLIVDTRSARATVDAAEESIFVLAQQDAPSWRVFVDGVQSEKLLAGGIFRAVRIPRGGHEVEWRWVPTSFRAGATMTIITALSLHLIFFVKRFSRRKFSS